MFYARVWLRSSQKPWVKQTWTIQTWPGTIPFTVSRPPESFGRPPPFYACGVNGFNIQCPGSDIRIPSRRIRLRMSEPKGHWQISNFSVVLDLTFASRIRGDADANVKSTTLQCAKTTLWRRFRPPYDQRRMR